MVVQSLSYLFDRLIFPILLLVQAISLHTALLSSLLPLFSFHFHLSRFMPASQHPTYLWQSLAQPT
jgi:hypothetical protein